MAVFKFRSSELLIIRIAREQQNITLSDIGDIYDLPLDKRDEILRKIGRLVALKILKKTDQGITYVNEKNIPEECFKIEFQKELS